MGARLALHAQAGSSGVDVVTRLVTYPIDGQSASQQWQAFGYEALVTNQLLPLVQANMTASGMFPLDH